LFQELPLNNKSLKPSKKRDYKQGEKEMKTDASEFYPCDDSDTYGQSELVSWTNDGRHVIKNAYKTEDNRATIKNKMYEDHKRHEKCYEKELDKIASTTWHRKKLQLASHSESECENDDIDCYYSPVQKPATSSKLHGRKKFVTSNTVEEAAHKKHMKKRWNREYDDRMADNDRGKNWNISESGEYCSAHLSSNDEEVLKGQHHYDDRAHCKNVEGHYRHPYRNQFVDADHPSISSSSNTYLKKDTEERSLYQKQHHGHLLKHYHHYHSEQPIAGHPSYHSYRDDGDDVEDDPRDVDIRELHSKAQPSAQPADQPRASISYRTSKRFTKEGHLHRPSNHGYYDGNQANESSWLPSRQEKDGYVSVEDFDGKTTYYHYEDDVRQTKEIIKRGRQGKEQDRNPLLMHSPARELSRESVSSTNSIDYQNNPPSKSKRFRQIEIPSKMKVEKLEGGWKIKRALSPSSSGEDETMDWKEKQKQKKRNGQNLYKVKVSPAPSRAVPAVVFTTLETDLLRNGTRSKKLQPKELN
jgi:hypothetical protein